jgi:hypothetical protein
MFQEIDQELRAGVGFGGRAFLEIRPRGPARVGTPKTLPRAAIAPKPEPIRMWLAIFAGMMMSSGNISPSSAAVKVVIPPCRGAWEARPAVYVTFRSTHQNTLSCRTPNAASRVASSWEHTWCSKGIIGLTSHVAGSAHTPEASCRTSSSHGPSWCRNTHRSRGDTKLPCNLGQAAIAFLEVRISQISGGKALVLCQHGSSRTPRAFFSRPRRGSPFYVGLYGAGLLCEPGSRYARRGRNGPGGVVQPWIEIEIPS